MTLEVFPLWMLYRDFEVPVGTIVMWPAIEPQNSSDSKVPTGWKICDGSSLSRSEYQDLWNTIRLTYTSSDNNATFNLPDLTNTFIRGTNPDYNSSSGSYSWDSNKFSGVKQEEEFKHSMIDATIVPNISISSYEASVSYQIKTNNDETHIHDDAVPEGYRFTTIDDADEQTAGHDWADADNWNTVKAAHLPSRRYNGYVHDDGQNPNSNKPFGTFYDSFGDPDGAHSLCYQEPARWVHSHPDHTLQSSNASEGIICYNEAETWDNYNNEFAVGQTSIAWNQGNRDVDSQGQLNSQGYNIQTKNQQNGQLLGQPSVGNHTHQFIYSIDRTHSHEVTGQSGELQISGLGDKIEPKHIPMLYIIYTGVI